VRSTPGDVPTNGSGKVDKQALQALLAAEGSAAAA
jgi:hypothetical protein